MTPAQAATAVSTLRTTVPMLAAARTATAHRRATNPTPAGKGGGSVPDAPPAPWPNAAGTGSGAGSGGLSSSPWCDVFLVLLVLVGRELRRNRVRPVFAGPVGVVSLLQRPG
jgi:hypothetical protein